MKPTRFESDELLDDPRFWSLLYEYWVKPRVGDGFVDGDEYFFSIPESSVESLFQDLDEKPTQEGHYPEYSVLLTLRNAWRVGVVLSMWPTDFEIQDVVGPPSSDSLVVFGVNGGNSRLPALRWEELLMLGEAVVPGNSALRAKAILLLYPAICLSSDIEIDEVREVMESAWMESRISISHPSELVDRFIDDFLGSRQQYPEAEETVWSKHIEHGWINDSHHSLRNPRVTGSERVTRLMRELFSTLERVV